MSDLKHRYSVFGLRIASEICLPELHEACATLPVDVEIREGRVDAPAELRDGYSAGPGGTVLSIPKVGRYLVRDGKEIVLDADPESSDRNRRLYLLGSALGALLHQRGLMPLHANTVVVGDRAIAFSGHSGAGKSTIAAWFHDRGYPVLTDDVCVLTFGPDGRPLAQPGIPRLRLWEEALKASGRDSGDHPRSFDDMDKYDVPIGATAALEAVPLDRVYLLRKAEADAAPATIRRLVGAEAVDALVANTYRGAYLQAIGGTGTHLMTCVRIARTVRIFEASRRWGFDAFDDEAARLEAHVREQI